MGESTIQWLLLLIAGVTAAFIGWQAWETRRAAAASAKSVEAIERQAMIMERQTRATEIAAAAAKASADAHINIEKAWLLPHGFVRPAQLPSIRVHPVQTEEFTVTIKNAGRTLAWLDEWLCRVVVTDTTDIQGHLDFGEPNRSSSGIPFPSDRVENFFASWRSRILRK